MLGDQTMKAGILCGGKGTRLGAHGEGLPKALFDIGGRPILWHIMKIYAAHGVTVFVLCLGHKGDAIREHFAGTTEPWRIAFDDAGEHTQTGGRIKHIAPLIGGDESFMVTYGDGVADLDIRRLAAFHSAHGRLGTVTAVRPALPFGLLDVRAAGRSSTSWATMTSSRAPRSSVWPRTASWWRSATRAFGRPWTPTRMPSR